MTIRESRVRGLTAVRGRRATVLLGHLETPNMFAGHLCLSASATHENASLQVRDRANWAEQSAAVGRPRSPSYRTRVLTCRCGLIIPKFIWNVSPERTRWNRIRSTGA